MRAQRQDGFSLIEMLAALAILALAGIVLMNALSTSARSATLAREMTLAQIAAQNLPRLSHSLNMLHTARVGGNELKLLTDVLPETPRWKRWSDIEAGFDPIVVGRLGHGHIDGRPSFPEISSTEIRHRLSEGLQVDHLVPAPVLALLPEGTFHGG